MIQFQITEEKSNTIGKELHKKHINANTIVNVYINLDFYDIMLLIEYKIIMSIITRLLLSMKILSVIITLRNTDWKYIFILFYIVIFVHS